MKKSVFAIVLALMIAVSGGALAMTAGTYEAEAQGMMGMVKIAVTVSETAIEKVEVVAQNETPGISDPAIANVPAAIVEAQSLAVDTVASATVTSNAILAAAEAALAPVEEPEHEAEIGIDHFAAVELRVAKIIACEPVPKAKKLLKLQVDLGYEKRQVVSGIAKFYTPDELVGKKIALVCNLKPAKLCGVDSFGMLLASGEEDVKVVFLSEDAKVGDRIH